MFRAASEERGYFAEEEGEEEPRMRTGEGWRRLVLRVMVGLAVVGVLDAVGLVVYLVGGAGGGSGWALVMEAVVWACGIGVGGCCMALGGGEGLREFV